MTAIMVVHNVHVVTAFGVVGVHVVTAFGVVLAVHVVTAPVDVPVAIIIEKNEM
jgi:hypothetical protein